MLVSVFGRVFNRSTSRNSQLSVEKEPKIPQGQRKEGI
jgi:hypothetical protein